MKTLSIIATFCALLFIGCGGSREATQPGESREPGDAKNPYESDFQPADHDPNIHILLGEDRDSIEQHTGLQPGTPSSQTAELVAGFQVQLLSTTDIDEARTKKTEAETLFPNEWIYLVYDPPTYKIRAGNFLSRFDADRFLTQVSDKGYQDAWVVPAKVLKSPPPPSGPQKSDETYRK